MSGLFLGLEICGCWENVEAGFTEKSDEPKKGRPRMVLVKKQADKQKRHITEFGGWWCCGCHLKNWGVATANLVGVGRC